MNAGVKGRGADPVGQFGRMPGLRDGVQVGGQLYTSFGVSLTVGFGEAN